MIEIRIIPNPTQIPFSNCFSFPMYVAINPPITETPITSIALIRLISNML